MRAIQRLRTHCESRRELFSRKGLRRRRPRRFGSNGSVCERKPAAAFLRATRTVAARFLVSGHWEHHLGWSGWSDPLRGSLSPGHPTTSSSIVHQRTHAIERESARKPCGSSDFEATSRITATVLLAMGCGDFSRKNWVRTSEAKTSTQRTRTKPDRGIFEGSGDQSSAPRPRSPLYSPGSPGKLESLS